MPVDNGATVFAPLPETTYRYTSTPWMDSATARNGLGHDATVCANEYGVTMVMSITSFSNAAALQEQAFADAGQLLNDVRWYHSQNSNTMKNGRNPETHEVLDELKAIDPLTVTAEAAAYQYAPPAAAETQQSSSPALWIVPAAALLAAALIVYVLLKQRNRKHTDAV